MSLSLYAHPFSSYCQKVLTALYENATPHTVRMLDGSGTAGQEFAALWPIKRMPVLTDGDRTLMEASIIIEYLGLHHPGPVRLIPQDAGAALDVRFMDRFFDNYVMTPMQRIVADFIRPPDQRDARTVLEAKALLDDAYQWLDQRMADREWACETGFSLADCAAAPALFYADWVHPMGGQRPHAQAYRRRLLARPSFARAVDEARPFRSLFPPGAPERD
ncbi:MAG: glutathione S-transferase family protein [Rubrivivax sp.]|nr:MAG: glutathione S-transferase family protein [Rubrivivax sp.]